MNLIGVIVVYSSHLMGESMTATYYHCTKDAQRHHQIDLLFDIFSLADGKKDAENITTSQYQYVTFCYIIDFCTCFFSS
jgi:hypothetical protein